MLKKFHTQISCHFDTSTLVNNSIKKRNHSSRDTEVRKHHNSILSVESGEDVLNGDSILSRHPSSKGKGIKSKKNEGRTDILSVFFSVI